MQIETLERANISQANRGKLIDQINTKYKEYLPNLITEKTTLSELKTIQDDVNKAFTQKILLLATEESLRDVSKALIASKSEELDIAQQLVAAEDKLSKFDVAKVGQGTEEKSGIDQSFIRAANAAGALTEKMAANRAEQDRLQKKFDATANAAKALGLDINKILTPDTPAGNPPDDPDPSKKSKEKLEFERRAALIEKEKELRIQANERVVQSDDQAAKRREIIELESTSKLNQLQIDIFKKATDEKERLTGAKVTKLTRDIADRSTEILEKQNQTELAGTIELINKERQLRIEDLNEQGLGEKQLARETEIINKDSDFSIEKAKLSSIDTTTDAYLKAQNEIAAHQKEIDKLTTADTVETTIESLLVQREATLKASAELDKKLRVSEEEQQQERQAINLLYDKKILEERLKLFDPNSPDVAKLKEEIADIDRQLAGISFGVRTPSADPRIRMIWPGVRSILKNLNLRPLIQPRVWPMPHSKLNPTGLIQKRSYIWPYSMPPRSEN